MLFNNYKNEINFYSVESRTLYLCSKSCIFCLHLSYIYLCGSGSVFRIRILIQKAPEYGSGSTTLPLSYYY